MSPDNKLTITPRPPKGEDGHKTFSIRIREEIVIELDAIVEITGRSRNELIGTMLEYALKNYEIAADGNKR